MGPFKSVLDLAAKDREIARLREALANETEACAQIVEAFGKPYTLNTNTGAMMFRAQTDKIAAAIRSRTALAHGRE